MADQDEIHLLNQSSIGDRQIFQATLALGIGVGLIYLAFLKPGIWGIDGNEMFFMSHSLVTKGNFTIPPGSGVLGRGGEYYPIRYPLLPLLATPFVATGLAIANVLHIPARYAATMCALVFSVLLTAMTTSLVALLALRLGSSKKGAYLAALSYAFGTTAIVYAREFFAEPLLAFITTLSLYWALGKTNRQHAGASILAGLAIVAKPAGIVIGPLLSAYFWCKRYPLRTIIGPLLGTGAGILAYFGYNYLRFESFFKSGQNTEKFQMTGMLERFFGLIFSPGAGGGLLWYCPPTILAILGFRKAFQKKPVEALLLLGVFGGYLALNSFWKFGGWNWGPRFLVPTLPLLLALVALLDRKWWKWIIGLTVLGFFWNAPTLISFYQRYYAEMGDAGYLKESLALWGPPKNAPLFNGWEAAFHQIGDAFSTNVSELLKGAGAAPEVGKLTSSELLRIVAVWWWVLPAAGIPIWVGFVLATILVGVGIGLLRRGWLIIKTESS